MAKLLIITPNGDLDDRSKLLASQLASCGVEVEIRNMSTEPKRIGTGRQDIVIIDDIQETMQVLEMKTRELPILLPFKKPKAQWKQERNRHKVVK